MSENKTESQSQDKTKSDFTDVSFRRLQYRMSLQGIHSPNRVGPKNLKKHTGSTGSARTEPAQTFAKTLETDL